MISKKVVFLFFILCLSVFSFEYFEATIKIFDKNEKPVPGASIKIGDLEILSNEEGIIETELPPTTYEVSIFKDGYYTRS